MRMVPLCTIGLPYTPMVWYGLIVIEVVHSRREHSGRSFYLDAARAGVRGEAQTIFQVPNVTHPQLNSFFY